MKAEKIVFESVRAAMEALDGIGSGNSRVMANRAVHINVLVRQVPGAEACALKLAYNDIGAEAAVSRGVYHGEKDAVTDMIVMGTVYQHREVRRVLLGSPSVRPLLDAIEAVVESAPETTGS
jgi:hypothetical protein